MCSKVKHSQLLFTRQRSSRSNPTEDFLLSFIYIFTIIYMTHFLHLNDVISEWDTSVLRLAWHYELLRPYFSPEPLHVHFLGSQFGDTQRTGTQLKQLIQLYREHPEVYQWKQTICVNNASRAKHTDSGNAKGSSCLWATVDAGTEYPLHIVGVDNDVFGVIRDEITSLYEVNWITRNDTTIADISQWSQFRSLEYRPLVQFIVQFTDDPFVHLHTSKLDPANLPLVKALTDTDTRLQRIHDFSNDLLGRCTAMVSENWHSIYPRWEKSVQHKWNQELHTLFQNIQCFWEQQKAKQLRKLENGNTNSSSEHNSAQNIVFEEYTALLSSLAPNELLIIDKDKFGNIKTLSAHKNGIYGLAESCGIEIWDKVAVETPEWSDTAYIVKSISDKTGQKCIWNGSSRWLGGEVFVELNYSVGEKYEKWEEMEKLEIGDKLLVII